MGVAHVRLVRDIVIIVINCNAVTELVARQNE
jgi:hypothetical protein